MSNVHIGNGTFERVDFSYRVPGEADCRIALPVSGQKSLPEDLDDAQLASVVRQLHRAGAVEVADMSRRNRPHSLYYTVDRKAVPVKPAKAKPFKVVEAVPEPSAAEPEAKPQTSKE